MTTNAITQHQPPQPNHVDELLSDLTAPQLQAVTHVDGPLLVLAGAGSGKTRVITRRIAHLIKGVGLAPWNVLAITFTNKAAGEMRQRAGQMLSERQAAAVAISTFHSFCARLIRTHADAMGLPTSFSIYDTSDQTTAVKQALADLDISSTNFPPGKLLSAISNAKNELIDAEAYAVGAGDFYERTVAKVFRRYEHILTQNKALDFDDLLIKTVQLMKSRADILAELRDRYQYVLIDEYQDTNQAQFVIAHTLAAEHRNLCVTGDPDQSIYSWRGANIRNILEFEKHYPDATVVRLEQNYRSTKNILAVADKLIQSNVQRKHKSLWTENETGRPIRVVRCYDEQHESTWVVDEFKKLHDEGGIPWSQMAVFYRVNSLSRVIEDAFRSASVPYQIVRGTAFYDRKEIKDLVAYLRVIANPADEVNLLRIINTPARGISDRTVKAMAAHAAAQQATLSEVMRRPAEVPSLNVRAVKAVEKFNKTLDVWRHAVHEPGDGSLRQFVEQVLTESGVETYYSSDKQDPDDERIANLGELVSAAQQFDLEYDFEHAESADDTLAPKLSAYLEQISLTSDVDAMDLEQGVVTLMTLHAAKGLEFPVVAIIALEDGLLPHSQSIEGNRELEEERRLCFVGITRAEQHLMLTHARYRTVFGRTMPAIPSRFIYEMPPEPIESLDPSDDDDWLDQHDTSGGLDHDAGRLLPKGTMVRHAQFGLGRVISVHATGRQTRARIIFADAGTKTLVLEYARLEILS